MKRWAHRGIAVIVLLSALPACSAADQQVGRWFDGDGSPVPNGIDDRALLLRVERGPEHCGWQDTLFMLMAWPLDRPVPAGDSAHIRTYVWTTNGAFATDFLSSTPAVVSTMPSDARATGLHRGPWELWISRAHVDDAVFVTNGQTIQHWGYTEPLGCF